MNSRVCAVSFSSAFLRFCKTTFLESAVHMVSEPIARNTLQRVMSYDVSRRESFVVSR